MKIHHSIISLLLKITFLSFFICALPGCKIADQALSSPSAAQLTSDIVHPGNSEVHVGKLEKIEIQPGRSTIYSPGECVKLSVVLEDSAGDPVLVADDTQIQLSAETNNTYNSNNSVAAGLVVFSQKSDCSDSNSKLDILKGQVQGDFYFSGSMAGNIALLADAGNGINTAVGVYLNGPAMPRGLINAGINPNLDSKLKQIEVGSDRGTFVFEGECLKLSVLLEDSEGNPISLSTDTKIQLLALPNGSDPGDVEAASQGVFSQSCDFSNPVTEVPVPSGQTSVEFYFSGNQPGDIGVMANAGNGITSGIGVLVEAP